MGIPVEQISEDDVIVRQQEMDRRRLFDEGRPRSFEEYLVSRGYRGPHPGENAPGRESLAQLADRAKRAPRTS